MKVKQQLGLAISEQENGIGYFTFLPTTPPSSSIEI